MQLSCEFNVTTVYSQNFIVQLKRFSKLFYCISSTVIIFRTMQLYNRYIFPNILIQLTPTNAAEYFYLKLNLSLVEKSCICGYMCPGFCTWSGCGRSLIRETSDLIRGCFQVFLARNTIYEHLFKVLGTSIVIKLSAWDAWSVLLTETTCLSISSATCWIADQSPSLFSLSVIAYLGMPNQGTLSELVQFFLSKTPITVLSQALYTIVTGAISNNRLT